MGCCSSDALPDVPEVIQPDPDFTSTATVVTKRIGRMWGRDYSVHRGSEFPKSSEEVKQKMWMWFNKSDNGVIDLENFVRGEKEDPNKGRVLYTANVTESPHFDQFNRVIGHSIVDRFVGIFNTNDYDSDDDEFYIKDRRHRQKFKDNDSDTRKIGPDMITKWKLNTQAVISDGDLGRSKDILQGRSVIMEVFSKGTVATGWEERTVRTQDEEGREQVHNEITKEETEFVDRVEFRLLVDGELWAEWEVRGDTHYGGGDTTISTPLFETQIKGGWFTSTEYVTTTKPDVDPALAMMIAHLCYTEYSVAEVKRDLHPNTPNNPPRSFDYKGLQADALKFGSKHLKHGKNFKFH